MVLHNIKFLGFFCFLPGVVFCVKNVEFWNRWSEPIWLGGQADGIYPLPNGGGWILKNGERKTIQLPDSWKGRFWPRTWCNYTGNGLCETGSCSGFKCRGVNGMEPYTTIEFKMRKIENDEYALSFVHGFNMNAKITPIDPEEIDSDNVLCSTIECNNNLLGTCPEDLLKRVDGYSFGCRSPCDVFQEDLFCCLGEFKDANTCHPEDWPINYAKIYKDNCPRVKTYEQDIVDTVHFCRAVVYLVEFS